MRDQASGWSCKQGQNGGLLKFRCRPVLNQTMKPTLGVQHQSVYRGLKIFQIPSGVPAFVFSKSSIGSRTRARDTAPDRMGGGGGGGGGGKGWGGGRKYLVDLQGFFEPIRSFVDLSSISCHTSESQVACGAQRSQFAC